MLEKQPVRKTVTKEKITKYLKKNGPKHMQPPISEIIELGHSSIPGQGFLGEWLTQRQGEQKSNRFATAEEPTVFFS